MMSWNDGGWSVGQWMLISLLMLIFWGGLIAFGVWAVHSLSASNRAALGPPQPPASHADEVLSVRYARGEIDADEYNRRRAVLHSTPPGP